MKRLVLLLILVPVAAPPAATGHVLSLRQAQERARKDAARLAATIAARSSVPGCRRLSRHTVDCRARYVFASGTECEHTIRVRFANPDPSRRTRVSYPHKTVCKQ